MMRCILLLLFIMVGSLRAAEATVIKPLWEVKLPPYRFNDKVEEETFGESAAWCREKIKLREKYF